LGGAIFITARSISALGKVGIHTLSSFDAAANPGHLSMCQPIWNAQGHLNEYSWLAVLLGYPIVGIWYWCGDQTHVQRVLGAKDLRSAQDGPLFAGFLKITPVFLMVLPGVIGSILWQRGALQLANAAGASTPDYNSMLPSLINTLVPVGLRGLLAACMAAALMSCMAAALNSCGTLISIDIVKRLRPHTTDARMVTIGRIFTAVVMVLAMLWSTQGDQFGTIFEAINKIPMTFAPAVTTVFVLGILWKRGTWQAALSTLYIGSAVGIVYFIGDLPSVGRLFLAGHARPDFAGLISDPVQGLGVPFMLVGPLLACLCILIYVLVSLATPAMEQKAIAKVCWDHPLQFLKGRIDGGSDPRVVSFILFLVVLTLYWFMR
jgi:SSS family solute:Na+ symporter